MIKYYHKAIRRGDDSMASMDIVEPLAARQEKLQLSGAAEAFLAEPQVTEYNNTIRDMAFRRRESKLGSPEEVEKRIKEYFLICEETSQLPSIKALSLYIGVPYKTLKKYIDDPTSRYNEMLVMARDYCHIVVENGALNNKVNPATYMFTAANYYDMKNTQSVEIGRTSAEKDLAASRETINALKSLLEREKAGTVSDGAVETEFVEKKGDSSC